MRIQASKILRFMPLVGIGLIIAAIFYYHGYQYLSLNELKSHHQILQAWVSEHHTLALISFIAVYIVATTCAIPWNNVFTIAAGFLFGIALGSLVSIFSATIGAIFLFLSVRYALGNWIIQKAGNKIKNLQNEFLANSTIYLLIMRIIPVVPFSIVNILAALAEVRISTFIYTTLIGMLPETLLYSLIGHNINRLSANNSDILFSPSFLLPIAALCLLLLLAIVFQKRKLKKNFNNLQPA